MRKPFSLLLAFVIASVSLLNAQHVVKINPLGIAIGDYQLAYEYLYTNNVSINASFTVNQTNFKRNKKTSNELAASIKGINVNASIRYYVTAETLPVPSGLFVGPLLDVSSTQLKLKSAEAFSVDEFKYPDITQFRAGGIVGYQLVFKEQYTIEAFGGVVYGRRGYTGKLNLPNAKGDIAEYTLGPKAIKYKNFSPKLGVRVGIYF